MATTSSRLLRLLSLLGARRSWSGQNLAERLGVSTRTLPRDVESLRALGYPVHAGKGPEGGYRLGVGSKLPPLLLDDEQAIAVAVALQTAPSSVSGIDDAVARALTSIKAIMPAHLRAEVDAMHLTAIANPWEFSAHQAGKQRVDVQPAAGRDRLLLHLDANPGPDPHGLLPGHPGDPRQQT